MTNNIYLPGCPGSSQQQLQYTSHRKLILRNCNWSLVKEEAFFYCLNKSWCVCVNIGLPRIRYLQSGVWISYLPIFFEGYSMKRSLKGLTSIPVDADSTRLNPTHTGLKIELYSNLKQEISHAWSFHCHTLYFLCFKK